MDRRRALYLMGAAASAAAFSPFKSGAETSPINAAAFCGDFETGDTSQYAATELSGGAVKPRIINNKTRSPQSLYACEYQLDGRQYRSEMVPAYNKRPYVATEGADLYYGWSVYFDKEFPKAPWQICGQWHQTDHRGLGKFDSTPPPMAFYIMSHKKTPRWRLANNGENLWGKGWSIDLGSLPSGLWTDVMVHARFSSQPEECLVEIWLNGVPAGSIVPPVPILYPTDDSEHDRVSYFKVGYYRHPKTAAPGKVIFDNVNIATDRAIVEAGF